MEERWREWEMLGQVWREWKRWGEEEEREMETEDLVQEAME